MKNILLIILIQICAAATFADTKEDLYNSRYKLSDPYKKLVDNYGNGYDFLYGTRNFRVVFSGIQYRGGANNAYHHTHKRDNENPLPDDGLMNLCEEGFSEAVYLYKTNFSTAPPFVNCINRITNKPNHMVYAQISPFTDSGMKEILVLIRKTIMTESLGPVYTHCWNGWHASGLISAVALRQFCDWPADKAVAYWDQNTDGVNSHPSYEKIRTQIKNYQSAEDLKLARISRIRFVREDLSSRAHINL